MPFPGNEPRFLSYQGLPANIVIITTTLPRVPSKTRQNNFIPKSPKPEIPFQNQRVSKIAKICKITQHLSVLITISPYTNFHTCSSCGPFVNINKWKDKHFSQGRCALIFHRIKNVVLADTDNYSLHRLASYDVTLIAVDNLFSCHVTIINCKCSKIIFSLSIFPYLEI